MDIDDKEVKELVTKAASAHDAGDAMKYSQAACNVINALYTLNEIKRMKE